MTKKDKSYEQQIQRIQEIVNQLEKGDIPLEQSLALFKEGTELVQHCRKQLNEAKHKVQIYSQGIWQDLEDEDTGHEPGRNEETDKDSPT
ncbi:MAG TPA: exodeoxyribonuclease VII small subunit [Desulfohalobiaceae bacterium]|nr:exodeoxyribonuclease VII small subunit [Desulfohalobiaceae bacterium]